MLAEIYIETLLIDEELADQVRKAWDKGEIDDQIAWLAWWFIASYAFSRIDSSRAKANKDHSCR